MARAEGELFWVAVALRILGTVALAEGELATARRLLEESLTHLRQLDHRWMMAWTLDRLAWVGLMQAQHEEAQAHFVESLALLTEVSDVVVVADSLEGVAALASAVGRHERALRLVGAAAAIRESLGAPLHPMRRALRDKWLESLRQVVGEATAAGAWTSGHSLTLDQAVALALEEARPTPAAVAQSGAIAPTPAAPLTTREHEVAALLAQGLSNRQIAEQLVITERTVAAHVEHILDKLDFSSRTQIALWAAGEHSLRTRDPA